MKTSGLIKVGNEYRVVFYEIDDRPENVVLSSPGPLPMNCSCESKLVLPKKLILTWKVQEGSYYSCGSSVALIEWNGIVINRVDSRSIEAVASLINTTMEMSNEDLGKIYINELEKKNHELELTNMQLKTEVERLNCEITNLKNK